jgi:hypothetical protein
VHGYFLFHLAYACLATGVHASLKVFTGTSVVQISPGPANTAEGSGVIFPLVFCSTKAGMKIAVCHLTFADQKHRMSDQRLS